MGALNFRDWPRSNRASELAARCWGEHPRDTVYTPDADDTISGEPGDTVHDCVARLARTVRRCGGVHLLVDESSTWCSASRGREGELERLYRSARHLGVTVAFTTQHGGDVSPGVLACRPELFLFRTVSVDALDRIARAYGRPPARGQQALPQALELPDHHFIRLT